MDVINHHSTIIPIVITSEDEDDDDVVLVKEEKAIQDADTNDDVIFVSMESSLSLQKHKSENQKNNYKKDLGLSSSSSVGAYSDITISHDDVQYFNSALLSLSCNDGILRPLGSTESALLETDPLSPSVNTKFTLIESLQASSTCKTGLLQEVKTRKDAELLSVNSRDKLHQNSGMNRLSEVGACQESPLLKTMPETPTDNALFSQEIIVDSLCVDEIMKFSSDVLASPCDDSVELAKTITSVSSQSQQSTPPCVTHSTERDPIPGTSNQSSSSHGDFHGSVPALDGLKLCIPEKTSSSSNSNSPLPLDIDIFNTEDLISLFNFFDNHQTENDQTICDKNVNASDSSDIKVDKISKLVGSVHVNQRILPGVKKSAITEYSVSSKSASLDYCSVTKSDKQVTCNVASLSPDSNHLDYFKTMSHKASIISSVEKSKLGISSDKLPIAKYNDSSVVSGLTNGYKSSGLQSRSFSSGHAPINAVIRHASRTHSSRQGAILHQWSQARKHKLLMRRYDNILQTYSYKISPKSVSQDSDAKVQKNGATHWQIVSSESSRRKRGACFETMNDELPKTKQKILEASLEEKPSLKIKLKMVPPIPSSVSHTKLSTVYHPCNIGFKKSIIRRQASLIGGALVTGVPPNIHRSVSDSNMKGPQEEEDIQMCATCCKTVSSKKMAKCGKGHDICATCLEPQVKVILTGDVKQKNVKCPASMCTEALSFDELRKTLPSFVVDILEKKLDNEYLSYITKWMFTDEQLKTRSEFATLDTKIIPSPALSMRKYEEIYTQESCDVIADLPTFWAPMERGAPVMAFEVVPDTEEYRALACQFYETCPFGDYDIARIIRVQNPILWKYFSLKQSEMIQENEGMDVVVKQLYHGTHHSTLEAIAKKGFDWRLSGKHGTVYGNGSYFARTAHYSHAYTDCAGSGVSVKAGGRSSYMFQTGTSSSLRHYYFHPLGLTSLWGDYSRSSQSQPLQPPLLKRCYTLADRQVQAPNQSAVKDATCGMTPSASRSSALLSSLDDFLGASTSSAASSMPFNSSLSSSSMFSTSPASQTQSSNFGSCFTNPSLSSVGLGLLQTTSFPTVSLWDTLEDLQRDKRADIEIKSDQVDHIPNSSGSATVLQCREKGTTDLSSAFARNPNSKTHFMFVAKVLVGRHTGGKSGLKRPPPLDESNPYGKCYDSCVDNIFSPQVYVIFDSNQAYPEYIIEYKSHKS